MKKYFLILLLGVITFSASSQVTIPDKVARWYLEQASKVKLLEQQDSISSKIIETQGKMLINKDKIIETYQTDSMLYEQVIATKDSIIADKDSQITLYEKKLGRVAFERDLAIGAGGGVILGLSVGQPLVGGLIGVGVAVVRKVFKKRHNN